MVDVSVTGGVFALVMGMSKVGWEWVRKGINKVRQAEGL